MFDTFARLPLHPLVVHAVVVLLPLMALLTVLVAVRKNLRARFGWWVTAADGAVFLMTLVTKESGQYLQQALGGQVAREHGELGSALPWFALVMALAAAATAATSRNRALGPVAAVVSVVAAGAAVFWAVRTGDAGTRAVWGR